MLVKIINWKRAVGVDRLIRLERILNDLQNRKGLVISNSFSEPAIKFAKKHGLITYQRKHLHPLSDYK
ncbi:MAG: restriction endonuclease [Candidatus Heimdallarchaeota archaeon]